MAWLWVSAVFFALGEYLSKKYALEPSWEKVAGILAAYLVSVILWLPAIRETKDLARTGAAWSVLGLAMTVVLGVGVFGERLSGTQWVGLGLAAVAVWLL